MNIEISQDSSPIFSRRISFRYQLLNALAHLMRMPMLKAAPAPGGAAAQEIEVARLQALQRAGVNVPQVLHVAPDWFAMRYLPGPNLLELLQRTPDNKQRLEVWLAGARALADVHAKGQCLSQAFARNFIWVQGQVCFIDFEDDPLQVMPLAHAQVRDWLAYLHSTVWVLRQRGLNESDLLSIQELLALMPSAFDADLLHQALQKMAVLRHLPKGRRPWGKDLIMAQALGSFAQAWKLHGAAAQTPSR